MERAEGASDNTAKHRKTNSPVHRWRPVSTEASPRQGRYVVPARRQAVDDVAHISEEGNLNSNAVLKGREPERISKVLEEAVKSPTLDYSHFISLPLAIHPDLVEKLNHFQSSILGVSASDDVDSDKDESLSEDSADENYRAKSPDVWTKRRVEGEKPVDNKDSQPEFSIDKSIFIKPKKFHLTVLMLKLWNKDRIAKASDVLQSLSSQVNEALENRPTSIQLRGLACMKGSPARAQVVYAPVLEVGGEGRLVRACSIPWNTLYRISIIVYFCQCFGIVLRSSLCVFFIISVSVLLLLIELNHPVQCCFFTYTFLEVITEAFVKSGLVLEWDVRHELRLHATIMTCASQEEQETEPKKRFVRRSEYIQTVWGNGMGRVPISGIPPISEVQVRREWILPLLLLHSFARGRGDSTGVSSVCSEHSARL